jgi:hypothetical protein
MKALLAAVLLAFGAFAAIPSAAAAEMSSPVPPPCGAGSWACPTPVCRPTQVDQDTVLQVIGVLGPWGMVYTGPLFGVRLNSDCTVDAWETRLDCWPNLLPLAYNEQNVSAGRVDATIGTCGVGFICACMPADAASQSSIQPPVCGPTSLCEGPTCADYELASQGLPFDLAGGTSGCRGYVRETDPQCPGPTEPGGSVHADGIVSAWADTCRLSLDCTCDPLPIDPTTSASAALPPIFQPCPGMGGCCGVEPPEGGCGGLPSLPSIPPCQERSFSTTQLFGFLGPSAAVATHTDCTADAGEYGLPCPSLAPNRGQVDRTVGPVGAHADTCVPELDCTCDPILAPLGTSSAAIQPPVWIYFPVCVEGPCPPEVRCNQASSHVPEFSYSVTSSCHVTLTQDPLACEGMRYESTTVGPVTVNRAYCGPGIDP